MVLVWACDGVLVPVRSVIVAGGGGIVGHLCTSVFARTRRARRRVVACRVFIRILVRQRHDFRFANVVVGVVVQTDEAEIGQGAETGFAQVCGDLVVAGGGDLAGPAGPGRGDPDQVSLLVGEREKQQAEGLVLAGVILPVLHPGAAAGAGADHSAVQQDDDAAPLGDLIQGAVQSRGAGGEQTEHFQYPAAHGRGGDLAAAGHLGKTLVMAENCEHDQRLGTGGGLAPAGAEPVAFAAYQITDEVEGPLRHRKPNLVDSVLRALGGPVCLHARPNSRRGPSCYGGNRPVHCRRHRSARLVASGSGPRDPAPVGEFAQLSSDRLDLARRELPAQRCGPCLGIP